MKKIANIIEKSNQIKKRFFEKVKGKHEYNSPDGAHKHHHDKEEDELDDHNDSSNWSYA